MQLERWQDTLISSLTGAQSAWPPAALAVHRRNMRGARLQALANSYPVLRKVVGARCFAGLARDFNAGEADLNLYGRDFPVWLNSTMIQRQELATLPYLADLAHLEWQLHAAYYAADDPATDSESFRRAAQSPADWRLRLSASLSLLKSPWPVVAIWRNNRTTTPAAELSARDCHAVIWRRVANPRLLSLRADSWRLLQAARDGASIDALASQGMTPATMGRFLRLGWVIGAERLR